MSVTGWQERPISDLFASSLPGDWGSAGDAETGIPVLRSTNFVDDGSIDYSDIAFRSIAKARLEKRKIGVGTILIEKAGGSSTRPAGRVVYCDRAFNGTASNFVEVVQVKHDFDPKFVFYLLYFNFHNGLTYKYQQQTTGIINFKLREYSAELVGLPETKNEQAEIAEILTTVDRAIAQTEALIAKQQRIKTGLIQDLLTRGIDENGNLRSEKTHKFKKSPLGRIPTEWAVFSCEQLCREIVVGIVIRPAQYYTPEGVPVLRSANVRPGWISNDDLVFMSHRDNESLRKSQLRTGDLVTVRTGYPGTTAVVPPELDGCNCVDIVISRPKRDVVCSGFLSLWVNSDNGKRQVLEGQGGLAQQHFNVGEMRRLLVKLPKPQEQEQIESTIQSQEATLEATQRQRAKLCSLKVALMQDLLTGRRPVASLLSEPLKATA